MLDVTFLILLCTTEKIYSDERTDFFNQKIISWRNRFGGNSIERQGNMIQLIREIRDGNFVILAPDIDLGIKDSAFVPFFGILTNTITFQPCFYFFFIYDSF